MAKVTNQARIGTRISICDCDEINARLDALETSQCDCNAIDQRLTALEENVTTVQNQIIEINETLTYIQDTLTEKVTEIWEEILLIEKFIFLSDVIEYASPYPIFNGLGVSTISAGHTYNFWGTGTLSTGTNLGNNTTYYIIRSGQPTTAPPTKPDRIPELSWYQGDSTIGTLWIEVPSSPSITIYTLPLRFDSTGIYFQTTNALNNLLAGTTFKFTQALILVNPSSDMIGGG